MRADDDWARPVVHWELTALDPERQRAFYGALFNWDIGEGPIMTIPAGFGGPEPGPAGHLRRSDRPGVTLYVQVRDLRASLGRAVELGGEVVMEPFDVPAGRRWPPSRTRRATRSRSCSSSQSSVV